MKARFHAYNLELSAEYLHNMILLTVYITFVELSNVRGRVVIFKYSTIPRVQFRAISKRGIFNFEIIHYSTYKAIVRREA